MANNEPEIQQLSTYLAAFDGESDRGIALISASMLDERLCEIVSVFLADVPTSHDLLHGFNAPMGTLAARTAAAFSLALIQQNEYEEITIVRKIRNHFGHGWDAMTFESPTVCELCKKLPWRGPAEYETSSSLRSRFSMTVSMLLVDLMWRVRLVGKEQRKLKSWPNKSRA